MNGVVVREASRLCLDTHQESPHISFVLLSVNACYRSVKCKLEYNIRFLQKQHISAGEMLDLLPCMLAVLTITFKLCMFYITADHFSQQTVQ